MKTVPDPLLVMARSFPPSVEAGGSLVAYHLFKPIDPSSYLLVRGNLRPQDNSLKLPVPTLTADIWPRRFAYTRYSYLFIPLIILAGLVLPLLARRKPRQVLAFYPFGFYTIAAYWVSRFFRVPLSVYFFDVWEEAELAGLPRDLARQYEKRIIQEADLVFVISPALQRHFQTKYGCKSILLPHPLDLSRYSSLEQAEHHPERTIVYTGNVSRLNLDCVQNLVLAMRSLDDSGISLKIFTGQEQSLLRASLALSPADQVSIQFVPTDQIPALQQSAGILFAAIAFDNLDDHSIQTTFPTKFVEYLAAGRPILVVAPAESALYRYCSERNCAYLLDSNAPEKIAGVIEHIFAGGAEQAHILRNARAAALEFDGRLHVERFANLLHLPITDSP